MARGKIIFGSEILIDLTGDTISPEQLAEGVTAHDKSGEPIVGTSTLDVDSGDATAAEAELLAGKIAYARGAKLTGKMPNRGAVEGEISRADSPYAVPQGYHDGSGIVSIAATELAKLKPQNIRDGVDLLGIIGTMKAGEGIKVQAKTVTPTVKRQTIIPDPSYTHLSQVVVEGIPYTETPNAAGGTTVKIG